MIKYNSDVIITLKKSEEEMYNSNSKLVTLEHLILGTLKTNNSVKKLLNKYNITYNSYKDKEEPTKSSNKYICYSIELKKLLDLSYDTATRHSSNEITLPHIFITLINENFNTKLINILDKNIEDFFDDLVKIITNKNTNIILEVGTDLTDLAYNKKLGKAIGREKEINEVIGILARKNKNNPILIGEAGVGKTAIIEELANMIVSNKVPEFLKNKKIISLNIASIISGTKYRGEFEEKLTKILKECESNNNIIIFIDEIHTIVGAGGAEGAIDASNILKPILARGTLKIIGATTINEYKKYIAEDKALDRRFQKVLVKEPSIEETYNILKKIKREYELFHNVKISKKVLKSIVDLSNKYIFDRNNPDKSIDILDEACAYTTTIDSNIFCKNTNHQLSEIRSMKKESILKKDFKGALMYKEKEQEILNKIRDNSTKNLTVESIIKVIELKCNSNINDLESPNLYINLKEKLKNVIINQDAPIESVVNKLELTKAIDNTSPLSFILEGCQGSGRTKFVVELAKLLNRNIIKIDMSEFNSEISINKLLGSPQGYVGYNDNNTAFEDLKIYPNSIILINNIEKSHPIVLDLISKILSEGTIKNSKNETINFKNTIIFITSDMRVNSSIGYIKQNINNNNLPESINDKINYIIKFNKLSKDNIKRIINIQLEELNKNYNSNIMLNEISINNILKESYYDKYGAKNINRLLKNYIERELISSNTL